MSDFHNLGVEGEPVISELISSGVDLVSFSGDKLLGSVQAGLIVGKRGIVERLRRHPLYRALRSDKIRLAALEATLVEHQSGKAETSVPVLKMLALSPEEIEARARSLMDSVSKTSNGLKWEIVPGESATGGGAGPTANLPTRLIVCRTLVFPPRKSKSPSRNNSP